jgi:hypothetical protein
MVRPPNERFRRRDCDIGRSVGPQTAAAGEAETVAHTRMTVLTGHQIKAPTNLKN